MLKGVIVVVIPVDKGTDSGDSIARRGNHEPRAEYSLTERIFDLSVYPSHFIIKYCRLPSSSIPSFPFLKLNA